MKISQMTVEMVKEVSKIHVEAFDGSMNTRLGESYINKFFDWFVRLKGGIALVAIVETSEREKIIGYVIGAPLDYGKAMNRDLFWVATWSVMLRPWLFFSRQIRETIKARLEIVLTPPHQNDVQSAFLPLPAVSLVGLAVIPSHQGKGIGVKLIEAFEKEAEVLSFRSLRLSVYPENTAARSVYKKCGWEPREGESKAGKSMTYYRIL